MLFSRSPRMMTATAAVTLYIAGCGDNVGRPTATGFVGTWQRADGMDSVISIGRDTDSYRFRWTLRDGPTSVSCDEPNRCFVFAEGAKVFEYRFRVFERPESSDLFVECVGTPITTGEPLKFVDRLSLVPGELELQSQTIERDDLPLPEPDAPLRFLKTADEPF